MSVEAGSVRGEGSRRKGREIAMKLLYQAEIGGQALDRVCETFEELAAAPAGSREFALALARGVVERRGDLDAAIGEALTGWKLGRLAAIDIQVLRIGAYELLYRDDIPGRVSIDEAIELARTYSSAESARFVNGVLDAVATRAAPGKLAK